jgi:hypothetical protein
MNGTYPVFLEVHLGNTAGGRRILFDRFYHKIQTLELQQDRRFDYIIQK